MNGQPAFVPGVANGMVPPGPRDYFVYALTTTNLAAGDSDNVNVQISADSEFWWTALTYFADIAGAVQTDSSRVIPLVTLQLTDTGSGRQLFNVPIPLGCIAGSGTEPYRLIHPRKFARSTTIQATITNYSAATEYDNVYLALIGFKIYTNVSPLG